MNVKKTFIAIFAVFTLMLTGCATSGSATPNPSASAAQPVTNATPAAEAKKADDSLKKFGDVFTYTDGISISVSEPAAFVAGKYAMGAVPGQTQLVYTIVLTNGSDKVLEPMTSGNVSSGGAEAKGIFDTGNELGDIGASPRTPILPGQTVKWLQAYSIADPTKVTFSVSPSFKYTKTIFTNIKS